MTLSLSLVQYFLLLPNTKRMICKPRLTKTKACISHSFKTVLSPGGKICIAFLFLVEIKLLSTKERHRCIYLLLCRITEHDNQWQKAQMINRLPYQSSIFLYWLPQVRLLKFSSFSRLDTTSNKIQNKPEVAVEVCPKYSNHNGTSRKLIDWSCNDPALYFFLFKGSNIFGDPRDTFWSFGN